MSNGDGLNSINGGVDRQQLHQQYSRGNMVSNTNIAMNGSQQQQTQPVRLNDGSNGYLIKSAQNAAVSQMHNHQFAPSAQIQKGVKGLG